MKRRDKYFQNGNKSFYYTFGVVTERLNLNPNQNLLNILNHENYFYLDSA